MTLPKMQEPEPKLQALPKGQLLRPVLFDVKKNDFLFQFLTQSDGSVRFLPHMPGQQWPGPENGRNICPRSANIITKMTWADIILSPEMHNLWREGGEMNSSHFRRPVLSVTFFRVRPFQIFSNPRLKHPQSVLRAWAC
jgi:hypothetical protein